MRIVGGIWRGRSFDAPAGRDTRPTTDRMRESIASMILSAKDLDLSDCSVLDAFAGSGGMGLELLSRGARHCTLCEKDRKTAGVIRRNCASLGAPKSTWQIVCGDVFRLPQRNDLSGAPFHVVFLDPPYAMPAEDVRKLVDEMERSGLLAADALIVYERATSGHPFELEGFELLRSKKHKMTTVDMQTRKAQHV